MPDFISLMTEIPEVNRVFMGVLEQYSAVAALLYARFHSYTNLQPFIQILTMLYNCQPEVAATF